MGEHTRGPNADRRVFVDQAEDVSPSLSGVGDI
jgi:hypothetical protein